MLQPLKGVRAARVYPQRGPTPKPAPAPTVPRWHTDAACVGVDGDRFFPADENRDAVKALSEDFCDRCPVRDACLTEALRTRVQGIWAGTSTEARTKLNRPRSRTACPHCAATAVITRHKVALCVACVASWPV